MFIFFFFIFLALTALFILFFIWRCNAAVNKNKNNEIYIKFESFISLYNEDSNRWELKDDYVSFYKTYYDYTYYDDNKIFCCFHFIDWLSYKVWKYKKEKNDCKIKTDEKYQEIMDIINRDHNQSNKTYKE